MHKIISLLPPFIIQALHRLTRDFDIKFYSADHRLNYSLHEKGTGRQVSTFIIFVVDQADSAHPKLILDLFHPELNPKHFDSKKYLSAACLYLLTTDAFSRMQVSRANLIVTAHKDVFRDFYSRLAYQFEPVTPINSEGYRKSRAPYISLGLESWLSVIQPRVF